jgi:hypothetical protein
LADSYLNVAGKLIKLVSNGDGTFCVGAAVQHLIGTATGGTTNSLIDATKDIEIGSLVGKTIKMTIMDVDYIRTITENVGNEIKFLDTFPGAGAIATLGSGKDGEGKVQIVCKGDLFGAVGNEYSAEVVQGTATTGDDEATLNPDTKVLTITVNLTGTGEPRTIAAGTLETLLANTAVIKDKFEVIPGFTAGNIPMTTEPVPFKDGADGIPVVKGTKYAIF